MAKIGGQGEVEGERGAAAARIDLGHAPTFPSYELNSFCNCRVECVQHLFSLQLEMVEMKGDA